MKELDFEEIFERYHQALYRFCLSILGNPEDAREALQNTMVKALRALPGEQREIQLKPWLYRVARNESIDLLRRRPRVGELDAELAASAGELAEDAELRERLRTLLADLGELPERQRAALVMRELGGLDFDEIGAAFETSGSAARQTVYEARLSLQQLKAGREMSCERVRWELSAEDGRITRRRDIQAHLRDCGECRAFRDAIASRREDLAALAPLPAVASAGLLQAILGGKAAGAGSAAVGGAVGKLAATSTLVKSVATVAVVAAVAVPAADRGGLVHTGLFGSGSSPARTGESPGDGGDSSGTGAASDRPVRGAGGSDAGAAGGPAGQRTAGPGTERNSARSRATQTAPTSATAIPGGQDSPRSAQLPVQSAHGQETAVAHGGGRGSAGSRSQGGAHAPSAPSAHEPSHPSPAPTAGGKPATRSPVQTPAVIPDKGSEAPLKPTNGNPGNPEEPGAGKAKEER